jgi:hypothetical protein
VPLELPIFAKLPPWAGITLRTVAVAVPVLIGVLVATTGGEEDESGMGGFGDYGYLEPSSGDLVALDVTSIGAMR